MSRPAFSEHPDKMGVVNATAKDVMAKRAMAKDATDRDATAKDAAIEAIARTVAIVAIRAAT